MNWEVLIAAGVVLCIAIAIYAAIGVRSLCRSISTILETDALRDDAIRSIQKRVKKLEEKNN